MTPTLRLYRYLKDEAVGHAVALDQATPVDLGIAPDSWLTSLLEADNPAALLVPQCRQAKANVELGELHLIPPIERQEVWAAGVTYLRSKKARMEESDFSSSAYDRVYKAERPELFFKSLPQKAVGHMQPVGIRRDAQLSVPEPELAMVLNPHRRIVGYTIGNDMSSRDIEGANLLYLPQAKTYARSCALGPCLVLGAAESTARTWDIGLEILRAGSVVFQGQTSVAQIKRSFTELAKFLFRCQTFPQGAVLLTGTGIVPPNDFTLHPGDLVRIVISGIGVLENPVVEV